MVRRSRLKTANNRRRRLWFVWTFLLILGVAAVAGLAFKRQLINLTDIWRETFPAVTRGTVSVRGTIYDRNFKELAETLERVSLYVRPREVKDIPGTAGILSEMLGLSGSELVSRMGRDSHLVWLRRDIGQEDEEAVSELNLPGIYLHREFARTYPQQEYASHLIGYSENDLGLSGVEHYYNRLLNQDRVLQEDFPAIDLKGQHQTSTDGHDLVLTLDMKIQSILEKYVSGLGEKMEKGRITSLLLDTEQGKIIAGANYPSYNPNSVWHHENEILDNLFLTPMVIPEEIRKFFHDAALLQGGWELGTQVYPWSLVSGQNDFARQLRLWERLQFSTDLQVDFSGDRKHQSVLPQYVDCLPMTDLGTVPKTATPLKVLLGMTHLLNGGKKVQPHILDRIMERPSQRDYYYDAFHGQSRGRNVFPSLVSTELRKLLMAQGRQGALGSIALSGETVSLVMGSPDADGLQGSHYVRDRMSLVVISAEQPEMILLLVSRDEELEPGGAAAGISGNIDTVLPSMVALQQVSQNLADMVEVAEGDELNFKGGQVNSQKKLETETLAGMLHAEVTRMPDLTGFSLRKGLRILQRAEMRVTVRGTGRIVSQSPKAGETIQKGERCTLTLKIDPAPKETMQVQSLQIQGTLLR